MVIAGDSVNLSSIFHLLLTICSSMVLSMRQKFKARFSQIGSETHIGYNWQQVHAALAVKKEASDTCIDVETTYMMAEPLVPPQETTFRILTE